MHLIIVKSPITRDKIKQFIKESFGNMTKAVIDIEQEIMAIGGELHSDEETILLKQGSKQENLWGINIYTDRIIGFSSLINIRPSQGNHSMEIKNSEIRKKIKKIINKLLIA